MNMEDDVDVYTIAACWYAMRTHELLVPHWLTPHVRIQPYIDKGIWLFKSVYMCLKVL